MSDTYGVDCIGLALDLEKCAKVSESKTARRAMLAAANGLRIIDGRGQTAAPAPAELRESAALAQQRKDAERLKPLNDRQIEQGRHDTFSTGNPFCPCDSKTMLKAVRWAERAHGICDANGGAA